jgi:hypothetical protein
MSETSNEGLGPSRCYAADVKGCIRAIESIYPSIGKAMYDEPRDRLAFKVNSFIQAVLAEDRKNRKCVHDLVREDNEHTTADF